MRKFKAIVKIVVTMCVIILLIVAIVKMQSRMCKNIEVRNGKIGDSELVTNDDILKMLDDHDLSVIGKDFKYINANSKEIIQVVEEHVYVDHCKKVFFTGNTFVINIVPKKPLMRVFPETGEQYFIDINGNIIPYSDRVRENLIVANGHIKATMNKEVRNDSSLIIHSLYNVAHCIENNRFHAAQFRQMYVNKEGEIELIPTTGRPYVIFGNHERAQNKLDQLQIAYADAFSYIGTDQYVSLDVRFQNRIIAKKK